nr:glycosyltransferase [uncultured Flavobacterium sp.]
MENMKKKILLLSTGDVNGAYEAIYRLSKFYKSEGYQIAMLVKNKTQKDEFVIQYKPIVKHIEKKNIINRLVLKIKSKFFKKNIPLLVLDKDYYFMSLDETKVNVSVERILDQIGFIPDFVFTGMTNDFMNSTDLLNIYKATGAKIYTITVDMNHFTGGCHYAWDCKGYINGCSIDCPAILSDYGKDFAKINFDSKLKNAQEGKFQILSGSGWTLKQTKESKIYRNQKVFYNFNSFIDTKLFNANNRDIAKRIFEFDDSKFYILAGSQSAQDPRKGFPYFIEALKILETELTIEQKNKIVILVVSRDIPQEFENISLNKQKIDYITDYRLLILLYQAVDLFVNTSIEDAGPLMVSEAMACGTPVVGFDMGVVNNMVINDFNGYKAILKDSRDLAAGIKKLMLLSKVEYKKHSENAIKQIQEYSSVEFATKTLNEIINT